MKIRTLIFSSNAPGVLLAGHYSMKIRRLNFWSNHSMKIRRLHFSSYAPGALLDENKEVKFFE